MFVALCFVEEKKRKEKKQNTFLHSKVRLYVESSHPAIELEFKLMFN